MLGQISKYRHLYFQALPILNHLEEHEWTWRFLEIARGIHVEHNKRLILSVPDIFGSLNTLMWATPW
jgi:hypothetical protein